MVLPYSIEVDELLRHDVAQHWQKTNRSHGGCRWYLLADVTRMTGWDHACGGRLTFVTAATTTTMTANMSSTTTTTVLANKNETKSIGDLDVCTIPLYYTSFLRREPSVRRTDDMVTANCRQLPLVP
jgi:hypothetical protein